MTRPLTAVAIRAACRHRAAATVAIEVVEATGSTNADLMARAAAGAALSVPSAAAAALAGPTLLVARRQTAGRGRAGRTWLSTAGSLTFSLAWRFEQPLSALIGLPLAIGVAVAEVLNARGAGVQLKWPNDVLVDGAKLAGILIETVGLPTLLQPQAWAVIGVGINVDADAPLPGDALEALSMAASQDMQKLPATAVAVLPATDRNLLLAHLLDACCATLADFEAHGLAPFLGRWNALHAHAGRMVDIFERGTLVRSGRALGIDAMGRLLLETGSDTLAVLAGDVSLRPSKERSDAAVD